MRETYIPENILGEVQAAWKNLPLETMDVLDFTPEQ